MTCFCFFTISSTTVTSQLQLPCLTDLLLAWTSLLEANLLTKLTRVNPSELSIFFLINAATTRPGSSLYIQRESTVYTVQCTLFHFLCNFISQVRMDWLYRGRFPDELPIVFYTVHIQSNCVMIRWLVFSDQIGFNLEVDSLSWLILRFIF